MGSHCVAWETLLERSRQSAMAVLFYYQKYGDLSMDQPKPNYVRQQKGHSIIKHLFFGWILLWIPAIYYTISPDHYWHI